MRIVAPGAIERRDLAEGVTLWRGDCREVFPLLDPVDAIVTDPPYGIGFAAQPTRYQRVNGMARRVWDDSKPDLVPLLELAEKVVIWGGNHFALPPSRGWLAWTKRGNAPSMADMELAWTSLDMNARRFEKTVSSASSEKNLQKDPHPTQKPVELMRWSIEQIGEARTILDPYMGTGTTGVAAVKLGRRFVGIEIDAAYFEVACRRVSEALRQPDFFVAPLQIREAALALPFEDEEL